MAGEREGGPLILGNYRQIQIQDKLCWLTFPVPCNHRYWYVTATGPTAT